MFELRTERKTYSCDYKSALSILNLAKKNGAKIWLESETHYYDEVVMDILIKNDSIQEPEKEQIQNVNENRKRNKRVPKN